MQEIFWFFLGVLVHLLLDRTITFYKKIKFLEDIRILSFKMIGYAYQQWAAITAAKYIYLEHNEFDKEEIKILKNTDEAEMEQWKKEAVIGLNESVPPYYRSALKEKGWEAVMGALETHYREVLNANFIVKEGNPNAED